MKYFKGHTMNSILTHSYHRWSKHGYKNYKKTHTQDIDINISIEDFITFFKCRKEKTSSAFSGRHLGHYKSITIAAQLGETTFAETLVHVINSSIASQTPLHRWQHSAQVMIEKGKGNFIEHLRIIQLFEADLNFVLHLIWGNRMIRNAQREQVLNDSQYSLPGQTCQSAIWNKV